MKKVKEAEVFKSYVAGIFDWQRLKADDVMPETLVKELLRAMKRQFSGFPEIFITQSQSMTKAEFREIVRWVAFSEFERRQMIDEIAAEVA